jgi:bifunctional polynucleotide phosphatase/kinase
MQFHAQDTVFYHIPSPSSTGKIAAFDMDMTITYAENHVFPREEEDVYILPGRKEKLEELVKDGWTIAIFTNQFAKSAKEKRVKRVQTCIEKLGVPCFTFIATEKDRYRKPEIGMWEMFCEYVDVEEAIFVGDALGRDQDFSDSDKLFAENAGIECVCPEEFFPSQPIVHTPGKNMTLFVGMPGCGKSRYYTDHLLPLGYTHISQDMLKTKAKVVREVKRAMKDEEDICVDNTNPTQEGREEFYALAQGSGYTITVVYFVRDGRGWNEMRKEGGGRVPTMVYHLYFKKLVGPTPLNTPGEVHLVA